MNYKVECRIGWGMDVFYYRRLDSARAVAECTRIDGGTAVIYARTESGWEVVE